MRYLKVKISKKNNKSLLLEDYVTLDSQKVDSLVLATGLPFSVIRKNVYDVKDYLNQSNILGVTIEKTEVIEDDVHITYLKNDEYITIVAPKKLLNKRTEFSVSLKCSQDYSFVDFDSKLPIIVHTDKGKHKLKENEFLIKVS